MAQPKMSERKPARAETLRILASGDLLASSVEGERTRLLGLLEGVAVPVVLDLAQVKEIDSLGITLVLGVYKTCQKRGLAFSLTGVHPEIMRVFRLFSLPKLFPIQEA
jgi:anti-anti-sigma factor